MYIEQHKKNSGSEKNYYTQSREQKAGYLIKDSYENEELLEAPSDMLISEHSQDVLAHWKAPEFEVYERDRKWYLWVSFFLIAIIGWAIYSNSLVMAITFILIAVVGYIYIEKEPRVIDFIITPDGISAGKEVYAFDNIRSFWIFYEPPHVKIISLKTESHLLPFVHIPIHDEDPVHIRQLLLDYIPEEKQEEGLLQILERLLRL